MLHHLQIFNGHKILTISSVLWLALRSLCQPGLYHLETSQQSNKGINVDYIEMASLHLAFNSNKG